MSSRKEAILLNKAKKLDEALLQAHQFSRGELQSIAVFRYPGEESNYTIFVSQSTPENLQELPLEDMPTGFVMNKYNGDSYFLAADYIWNSDKREWMDAKTRESVHLEDNDEPNESAAASFNTHLFIKPSTSNAESCNYKDLVQQSIAHIEDGKAEKIVPARKKDIERQGNESLAEIFEELCDNYPNAFVSLVSSEKTGTWIGASPEILVKTLGDTFFETVAVAGTQPYTGQKLSQVAWKQKEIEEQALVSRYIINCFKKIRLREFDEHGPKTVIAGNLLHLKTTFHVNMHEVNFLQLASTMAKLLHPTSAVCGMPLESARDFLKKNEKLDRSFYSGYLGPVNYTSRTELYVNIRTMEVLDRYFRLYAGAGVTADSEPEAEHQETEHKFATLGKFLASF